MRITLADSNDMRGADRIARLSQLTGVTMHPRCFELTDAFNSIEHKPPHLAIFSEDLARLPEFDAIQTLCKCLSVRWAILKGSGQVRAPQEITLNLSVSDEALRNQLSDCLRGQISKRPNATAGLFKSPSGGTSDRIILIGSSTGGIDALLTVLGAFPANCPPTVVVQHTGTGFGAGLARVLDRRVEPSVREVRQGDVLQAGHVFLAAGLGAHACLRAGPPLTCHLEAGQRTSEHCPSVDTLFHSAVPIAKRTTAAILTGMGRDGAEGLLALRKAGAKTIGQDEATSVVFGMPRAAADLGASEQVLPLAAIGPALLRASQKVVTA